MIERTLSGDAVEHAFAWWVPVLVIAFGLAAAGFSVWYAKTRKSFRGVIGVIIGGFCAGLLGPTLARDEVIVTPAGFRGRTGFWYEERRFDVAFADLRAIHLARETVHQGGRTRRRVVLELHPLADRPPERLPVHDLLNVALNDVLERARNAGVKVTAEE